MTTATAPELDAKQSADTAEAVIISGPRKGGFVTLTPSEFESEEVRVAVRHLAELAEEAAASATALRQETQELVADLRRGRESYESAQ